MGKCIAVFIRMAERRKVSATGEAKGVAMEPPVHVNLELT